MTIDGGDFLGRTARSVSGRSQSDCALLVAAGKPDRPVALTLSHPLSCPLCRDAEAVDAAPVAFISVVSIDARALGDRVPPVHRRALRTPQQITRFFDGLDLLPPGVVSCSLWRPDLTLAGSQPAEVDEFCGVARKPPAPSTPARPA